MAETNRTNSSPLRAAGLWACLCLVVLAPSAGDVGPRGTQGGELSLHLRAVKAPQPPVGLALTGVAAIGADGATVPLDAGTVELRSDTLSGAGEELARFSLAPGAFKGLRLTFAVESRAEETDALVEVDVGFRIRPGAATTLFLRWDPTLPLAGEVPAITGRLEQPQLRSLSIYVTNRGSHDVTVIQRHEESVVGRVKVGREPMGIDVDPPGRKIYVANAGSDSVSVIDTSSRQVLDTLRLEFGARPVDVAVSPDGRRLFVVSAERATVTAFDTASLATVAEADVGARPQRVVVAPDGATVYVANRLSNSVTVLGAAALRVEATVAVDSRPTEMVVDAQGRVLVSHAGSGGVVVLGFNRTVERTLHYGTAIHGMALEESGRRLYLSAGDQDRVLIGQSGNETVAGFIRVRGPGRLAVDPDGKKIYVLDAQAGRLHVANRLLARSESSIPTGEDPYDLVLIR